MLLMNLKALIRKLKYKAYFGIVGRIIDNILQ